MFISGYEWPIACAEVVKYCGLWSGLALGLELVIWNESVPIQLAQCRFPGLAIIDAKILIHFFT